MKSPTNASREAYYHRRINEVFRFLFPDGKTLLYYGRYFEKLVPNLQTARCLIVSQYSDIGKKPESVPASMEFVHTPYENFSTDQKFDYVILNGALGETKDICRVLKNVRKASLPSTRIIIYQHNHLWHGIIDLAEFFNIKKRGVIQNWISIGDLKSCLKGMEFEVIRTFRRTICPLRLGFIGPLLNTVFDILPFLDFFKLDQFVIARPIIKKSSDNQPQPSLSIVLTVRDEKGNIEPIVQNLPHVCPQQEILFVEGHSSDGTREEIERVKKEYPQKNICLIRQPGKGQGDAIRAGFKEATGDIIILYEGDGTSFPEDIHYFYATMCSGRFEFIEGSRFIYPVDEQSMSWLRKLGNIFFARWFSWFLGQHTTDVLSGIKAITKKDYETIYPYWGFLGFRDPFGDFELLYGAFRFGLNFCELPIRYRPRPYGTSKTQFFRHGWYLVRMAAQGYWIFRSVVVKKELSV